MKHNHAQITLGRIVGVHGVRGWVKLHSDCRPREAILGYREFIATRSNGDSFTLKLNTGREQGKSIVAHFANYDDRDAAMQLIGLNLSIKREQLPATAANEFYWTDLIGLTVVNRQQQILGSVAEIFETGANDVLVIKTGADKKVAELLIPLVVGVYVDSADFDKQILHVDWESDWSNDNPAQ